MYHIAKSVLGDEQENAFLFRSFTGHPLSFHQKYWKHQPITSDTFTTLYDKISGDVARKYWIERKQFEEKDEHLIDWEVLSSVHIEV